MKAATKATQKEAEKYVLELGIGKTWKQLFL